MPTGVYIRTEKYRRIKERRKEFKDMCSVNLHLYARKYFGKDKCEICGMTNDEHIKKNRGNRCLSMHCRNNNPINMIEENWVTVCEYGCHQRLDRLDLRIKKGKNKRKNKIIIKNKKSRKIFHNYITLNLKETMYNDIFEISKKNNETMSNFVRRAINKEIERSS